MLLIQVQIPFAGRPQHLPLPRGRAEWEFILCRSVRAKFSHQRPLSRRMDQPLTELPHELLLEAGPGLLVHDYGRILPRTRAPPPAATPSRTIRRRAVRGAPCFFQGLTLFTTGIAPPTDTNHLSKPPRYYLGQAIVPSLPTGQIHSIPLVNEFEKMAAYVQRYHRRFAAGSVVACLRRAAGAPLWSDIPGGGRHRQRPRLVKHGGGIVRGAGSPAGDHVVQEGDQVWWKRGRNPSILPSTSTYIFVCSATRNEVRKFVHAHRRTTSAGLSVHI